MFELIISQKSKNATGAQACFSCLIMVEYWAVIIMKKQLRGGILLSAATIIWGSAFVAQSVGMDHIDPFTFQAVRCFLAVIGLLPVIAILDRFKKDGKTFLSRWCDPQLWKAGLLCGIPLFLACNLQQVGLVGTDAGKSGFLTAMYIVIVPVIGFFLKKKTTVMVPISVGLAVAGLYFLSCAGVTQISFSDLLLLGCAFMFAVQIVFVDRFASSVDPLRLNAIQAGVCAILSSIVMTVTEAPTLSGILACWLPLSYTGFLSMGAAYALQIIGQRDIDSAPAALIMSLESVFAAVFGALILHETMTGYEALGCGLVFVAVILSQIPVSLNKKMHSS